MDDEATAPGAARHGVGLGRSSEKPGVPRGSLTAAGRERILLTGVPDDVVPLRVSGSPEARSSMTVFDRSAALHHVGDDEEILAQLIQMFQERAPERLAHVEAAVRDRDSSALESEAHALKGTAATLGMVGLRDAAYAVERLGAGGSLDGAAEAVDELRSALDVVLAHLRGGGA